MHPGLNPYWIDKEKNWLGIAHCGTRMVAEVDQPWSKNILCWLITCQALEVMDRKLGREKKVLLFTPLIAAGPRKILRGRHWKRLENTLLFWAMLLTMVNSQVGEGPSFQRSGQGRLITTQGDIHLLKIRGLYTVTYYSAAGSDLFPRGQEFLTARELTQLCSG